MAVGGRRLVEVPHLDERLPGHLQPLVVERRVAPGSEHAIAAQAIVERQTKHMARLVDDLLDVSRIVTGKAMLDIAPLDVAEVATAVVQTWRDGGRLSAHDVVLRAHSVTIRGDRARIEQIVSNLLDNAVKFTPAGKRVSVDVRRDGAFAEMVVRDEGIGIAAPELGHVLDLFVQGAQDLSRQRGGMGIGLALVKRLVEMHGGLVFVDSGGPGHGTTFTVRFPIAGDELRGATPLAPREPTEPDDRAQRPAA